MNSTTSSAETALESATRIRRAIGETQTYNRSAHHAAVPVSGAVEVCETHISWVALAGAYAYKVKKPVRFTFLDYSTLERRHKACEVEIALNRRWAPDLYLGISCLVEVDGALYFDVPGEVIEYAVRMRRFSRTEELDRLLEQRAVGSDEVAVLACFIAQVQSTAPACSPASTDPVDTRRRALDALGGLQTQHAGADLDALARWLSSEWDRIKDLLQRRRSAGRVAECHGDLHCGNVVRIGERLVPFDGIDFDPALRCIDAASDVAFLVMDLQAFARHDLAATLLTAWLERSLDYEAVQVLPFFLTYRALVRSHISLLRSPQLSGTARLRSEQRSLEYLHLAMSYPTHAAGSVVLMHGFSGSGKSGIAAALVAALPAVRVRADILRQVALATVPRNRRYLPENVAHTYEELALVTRELLRAGFNAVVDATFLQVEQRRHFAAIARAAGASLVIVSCVAPPYVLMERVRSRRDDPSEATLAVLERQIADCKPLDAAELLYTVIVPTDSETDVAALAGKVRSVRQAHRPL